MNDCGGPVLTRPAWWYTSDASFTREMESLLLKQWHFVCPISDLSAIGDTIAQTIYGKPILVRRCGDGTLRGFYNVCRHRGGVLALDGKTNCKSLRCLYHGWMYDDEGRLCKIPHFVSPDTSPPFNLRDYSIQEVRVDSWRGLVFVSLDADGDSLESTLGELPQLMSDFDASSLQAVDRRQFTFRCNWKLYVENWLESYHLPWLHPELVKDVDVSEYVVTLHDRVVQHRSRKRNAASVYDGAWFWLAPNTAWNFYSDGVSIEQMRPLGCNTTEVVYTFCFKQDADLDSVARSIEMCEQVTRQDGTACEWVYRNMCAGTFQQGPLSPRYESAIHFFHEYLAKRVAYNSHESSRGCTTDDNDESNLADR